MIHLTDHRTEFILDWSIFIIISLVLHKISERLRYNNK